MIRARATIYGRWLLASVFCLVVATACQTTYVAPPPQLDGAASLDPNAGLDPNIVQNSNSIDVSQASQQARQAFAQGIALLGSDPNGAQRKFIRAISYSPHFGAAQRNLGALYQLHGDWQHAALSYQAAMAANANDGLAVVGLAEVWEAAPGHLPEAEQALRAFGVGHANDVVWRVALAQYLARQNRLDEAVDEAVAVLHQDERNAAAMATMGMVYRRQHKYDLALLALRQATDIDSTLGAAYDELGLVFISQDDRPRAALAFQKAANASPYVAAILNNLGVLQTELGASKKAVEVLQRAVALRPDRSEYILNLGNALRSDMRLGEAEQAYLAALKASNNDALYNLGVLYLDNDIPGHDSVARYELSVRYLRAYKEKGPTSADESKAIDDYVSTASKALEQEQKRLARDRLRKEKDNKDVAAAAPKQAVPVAPASSPVAAPAPPARLVGKQSAVPPPTVTVEDESPAATGDGQKTPDPAAPSKRKRPHQ